MKLNDLTGKRYGKLTVICRSEPRISPNGTKATMWKCKCDCGNEVVRSYQNIVAMGDRASCGCVKREATSKRMLKDMTGMRVGKLTVIRRVENSKKGTRWLCKCDCGNECIVFATNLVRGHTKSCGCYREATRVTAKTVHGLRDSRIYSVWSKVKDRCYSPNNTSYARYGGRGITMCDEWKNDPKAFAKWSYENGYNEDAKYGECTLDRIDNNKGYSPDNCRWVNEKVQANNRRSNRLIEHNGEVKTLAQWRDFYGMTQSKAYYHLVEKGRTIQELLDKGII